MKLPDGLAKSCDVSVRSARTSTRLPVSLALLLALSCGVGAGEALALAAVADAVAAAAVAAPACACDVSAVPRTAAVVTATTAAADLPDLFRVFRFPMISPPRIRSPRTLDRFSVNMRVYVRVDIWLA
ncbi:hypothetical protein ACFV5J_00785 [Streptomyces zaomyceticus]|uniref:hypothetical protein n=1 Tax=Streptomyces zaomyceticus TaxID=68286 RepID=UPI00365D6F2C